MDDDSNRANVLIVADDPAAGETLRSRIADLGEEPVLLTGAERNFLERGDDEQIDLVVTRLDPDSPDGRRLVSRLMSGDLFFGIPQIHVFRDAAVRDAASDLNPDVASVSVLASADLDELVARVRLAAEVGRLRRALSRLSTIDELTGTHNRRHLLMRLDQEFSRARRHGNALSLVLFDIDRLKAVNEQFGIEAGDRAIRQVAHVLASQVRREDIHGRWGENCFAAILPGTPHRGAAVFANKVRGDAEAFHVDVGSQVVPVKISAGISGYQAQEMNDAADLIRHAEQALAEAKRRGGNRVYIDADAVHAERRLILIADPDPELLDLAEDLLSMDDFRVIRADSVPALLETLKLRRPDLLVVDLQLAAEDGLGSLIEAVHSVFPDTRIPIIGLSRTDGDATPDQLAVDRFITKPFSVSVLRSIVRELVDSVAGRPTV